MAVVYRRMTGADAGLLSNVAADVFDEPVDPERVAKYLASAGHLMVLASVDDLVVGQCTGLIHHHPDKPTELYVDEVGTGSSPRPVGAKPADPTMKTNSRSLG